MLMCTLTDLLYSGGGGGGLDLFSMARCRKWWAGFRQKKKKGRRSLAPSQSSLSRWAAPLGRHGHVSTALRYLAPVGKRGARARSQPVVNSSPRTHTENQHQLFKDMVVSAEVSLLAWYISLHNHILYYSSLHEIPATCIPPDVISSLVRAMLSEQLS